VRQGWLDSPVPVLGTLAMTVVTPSQATAWPWQRRRPALDATDNTGKTSTPRQAGTDDDTVLAASSAATDRPFGPDGATILATEHWSLLGTRSMIWNEAMSRTAIFLTVLSASIVALALMADATGFGGRTTAVALVLLPVVFLLGLATYGRLVQINTEEVAVTRAMNRLRHAYLVMAPDLRPYFSTGHHDDEQGITTTYLMGMGSHLQTWPHFLVTTPTIVATVDAAVASAIVVLVGLAVEAPTAAVVAGGVVGFLAVWGALFSLQRLNLEALRRTSARFPTPPEEP
jgi:hypothetical protein